MDVNYYKATISKLDLKFAGNEIKNFLPEITKDFSKILLFLIK